MNKRNWKKYLNSFLSAGLVAGLILPSMPSKTLAVTNASDLIISEYIEGSSFNKAIELYNGTGSAVDLSSYTLELHTNGAATAGQKLKLSGTLADNSTYVIHHKDADNAIKAKGNLVDSNVVNFNGNDPVVLRKNNEVVDSIGQAGGGDKDFAKDVTLVRKSSVSTGDKIINDAFVPSNEWVSYPNNTFDYLGSHTMDGSNPGEPGEPGDPGDPGNPDPPSVLPLSEARQKALGETVTIKAVVAANLKNTVSVQDTSAGIAVRPSSLPAKVGDEVIVTGKLAEFRGLLQLDGATIVEKKENVGAPAPKEVTGAEVNEANESLLVAAKNITLTSVASGNYKATDGTTEFVVRDENNNLGLEVGKTYESITGIIQQYDADYQIIPRSDADIVVDSSILQPVTATPAGGTFVGGTTVTLSTSTAGASIHYTIDGSEPTKDSAVYTTPIEIKNDTTLKAVAINTDGVASEVKTFEYKITDSLNIHDLQGAGHVTPFDNQTVEGIQGIVTYAFTLSGAYYYAIQTPDDLADNNPHTSEAILLYSGTKSWPIQVGDLVSVTGKVSEFAYDGYSDANVTDLKTTQINVRNDQGGNVKVLASGVELPKPIILDESNIDFDHIDDDYLKVFDPELDAIDFWESMEGMRVEVGNVKSVSPQEHGDLITLLEDEPTNTLHGGVLFEEGNQNPNRIHFRLEPNGAAREFEVATGDTFEGPITGVVGYSYQNFKIYVSLDEMKAKHEKGNAKPEKTIIEKAEDKLTIASYNLENFSNNKSSTSDDKARKLARAIAEDMQSPDIVGVTEVQDNNGESTGDSKADQSYKRLIDAIKAAGGVEYQYVNIDPVNNADGGAPNANIRVGFLYNPARVTLTEGVPSGDANTAVGYENGKLTVNPGRIDPTNEAFDSSRKPLAAQFDFKGESVIVIANHWNSKSGDSPLYGSIQPPVYKSEAQRQKIAQIVYGFIEDVKTKNPDANIVSVGDFNDYQFARALKIHEGTLMKNMINEAADADRYTYLYQGNSQVLDHILVSKNLEEKTIIDILHINADFTDMAGRASDHDPVMVQIDLLAEDEVTPPITPEKYYNYKGFKTKKLTITKPSVSITLDGKSVITEGVFFTGEYAEFHGEGFATHSVNVKPAKAGAILDFKGTNVKKVIIDGPNVKEIRGAENVQEFEFINGASASAIKITNTKGEPISVPSLPGENQAPVVVKQFENKTAKVGETISILLTNHFADPEKKALTFTSTLGVIEGNTLKLALDAGTHIVGVTANDGEKSVTASFTVQVTAASSPGGYYNDAIGLEGAALKEALHEIIEEHKLLSYADVWVALRQTDEDPNNKNNVILFYSGVSRSKTANGGNVGQWNREHVWAQSHGGFGTSNGPGTDIHHLRPTDVQVNSSRGNLDFDNGGSPVNGCNGCKKASNSFEPPDRVKGDVARMLFYMATRYEKGDKVDLELNDKVGNGSVPFHGKLSTLLEWHKQDPVDAFERNRNEVIFSIQGNRNPFIDYPEWVDSIWKKSTASLYYKAS